MEKEEFEINYLIKRNRDLERLNKYLRKQNETLKLKLKKDEDN